MNPIEASSHADNPHPIGTGDWKAWNTQYIAWQTGTMHRERRGTVTPVRLDHGSNGLIVSRAAARGVEPLPPDPVVEILGGYTFTDPIPPRDVFAEVDIEIAAERALARFEDTTEAIEAWNKMWRDLAEILTDAFLEPFARVAEQVNEMFAPFYDQMRVSIDEIDVPARPFPKLPPFPKLRPPGSTMVCPRHGPQTVPFCRSCNR